MKKAQAATLQVLLGIAIVVTIAISINLTRTDLLTENIRALTRTKEELRNDMIIRSLFNTEVPMDEEGEPITKTKATGYICAYGNETNNNLKMRTHTTRQNINKSIETHLDQTIDEEYYFYMNCSEHSIEINEYPENQTDLDMIVSDYDIPVPPGELEKAYLYRWY